jgi:hypothetical protein
MNKGSSGLRRYIHGVHCHGRVECHILGECHVQEAVMEVREL